MHILMWIFVFIPALCFWVFVLYALSAVFAPWEEESATPQELRRSWQSPPFRR